MLQPVSALSPHLTAAMPSLCGADANVKRAEILNYFYATFDQYQSLFTLLADERAWYQKAIRLRHPLIFYYGHTAAFYINKLYAARLISARVNPHIEAMVAIGVDEMSWDDLDERHYDWPNIEALHAYRAEVRNVVGAFIESMPLSLPIDWQHPAWIILMGIEHERIHLETSSVLIRQLPLAWVQARAEWPPSEQRAAVQENQLIAVAAGRVVLGKPNHALWYGWDNEYGQQTHEIAAFAASKYLVSNHEFLQFVMAGGYDCERYWSDEGWAWATFAEARHPTFWQQQDEQWYYRSLTALLPMPWEWPVDVNCHEAQAFCQWLSESSGRQIQLPSEAEWMRLRQQFDQDWPDWQVLPTADVPANIGLAHGASAGPVSQFPQGDFYDVTGNVWQWTSTPIDAYDGFRVHPLYDDFSTPTFDGKHNLIKGGSWCSTGNCALAESRYAFRRHFFQHAGFRYVESSSRSTVPVNPYESDEVVSQYLAFHYGESHFGVANYPRACAELCWQMVQQYRPAEQQTLRALDLGCSVGRASFELARYFKHVDGVDYSARFIGAASELQTYGKIRYFVPTEGKLGEFAQFELARLGVADTALERVRFSQGDAANLKPQLTDYDLIFMGNLIDRLQHPRQFLTAIEQRLRPQGLLVITSPYTWLAEYTDEANWLGGYRENGEAVDSLSGLHRCLDRHFVRLQAPCDIPFVIRESARKHQYTLAQCTVWQRRNTPLSLENEDRSIG